MLIHLISDLARDRDDITERLASDIDAVLDEYGISPDERRALRSRDIDEITRVVQDEARQIVQAFADEEAEQGKGPPSKGRPQRDEWSWLYDWARSQGFTAIPTALPLPAPWPGWPSVVPTAKITPKTAVVGIEVQVKLELLDTDFTAAPQIGWKFTLSFETAGASQVAQTLGVASDSRSLDAKVTFAKAGVYNVMLTDPKGQKRKLIPGGFLVKRR